jgi:eukaryotic-like serine/threonine-protein kinase
MTTRPDVFLSYSREDQATARRYAETLKQEGFSVWWDQTLSTGEAYDEVTEKALEGARAVVVLWSKSSVTSRWVRAEATTADRNRVLAPVMIEPCKRPVMFELTQSADHSGWKGDANDPLWRTFVSDLHKFVQRGDPAGASASEPARSPSLPAVSPLASGTRGRKIAFTVAVAVLIVAAGAWFWQRAGNIRRAHDEVSKIAALVDAGKFPEAFARARSIRRIVPDDSLLNSLTPLFTTTYAITSTPAGAEVFVRGYDDVKGQWQHIGHTPLARVELPRQAMRWRFEKAGFQTQERANTAMGLEDGTGKYLAHEAGKLDITMRPGGEQPPDMVYVPGGSSARTFNRLPSAEVPPFYIDRHEVTNAAYKEFVDAGGYERRSWWDSDIKRNGKPLSFEAAMQLFVDATGRPGPAAWELGSYPAGKGDYPVAGISWYEAAAYARFRGKSLPTVFHWAVAAFPDSEWASSLAASTAPLSNFGTAGPASVAKFQGVGPFGTYDLLGNVREWALNAGPGGGWVTGGSWEDPMYSYSSVAPVALLERSRLNGFRLVRNLSEPENGVALRAALDLTQGRRQDAALTKPVSDEVFASLQRQFAYSPGPLKATAPITMATNDDWIKQRVTINTGYNDERMDVILFVPRRARPPFQPVVFFSGSQIFTSAATVDSIEPGFAAMPLDYIVKSGRMLVQPVFEGSYERFKTPFSRTDQVRQTRSMIEWRWDLGRTIDYLATRPDIDSGHIGYVGVSLGASWALPLLAVETRLRAAVLLSGGIHWMQATPFLDAVNYAPRIRIPVLMVNGRFDELHPVETSQLPLFKLLGSPSGAKRHVMLESGHGSPPRSEVLRETLGWYDKYLGEVRQ